MNEIPTVWEAEIRGLWFMTSSGKMLARPHLSHMRVDMVVGDGGALCVLSYGQQM
jgi:hypothetical protein